MKMMFWYGWHMPFWQAGLMWAGMIVFWGVLILGAYLLITSLVRGSGRDGKTQDAERILDERLARGEIDDEEYRRIRDLIGAGSSGRGRAGSTT